MLEIQRGDTETIDLTITDSAGAAVDLTGATLWFGVKRSLSDSDENAVILKESGSGITVVSAPAGTAYVSIASADTSALASTFLDIPLAYEVQLRTAAGAVSTVARGQILIASDVIQATS